jgi:hypothetical protein
LVPVVVVNHITVTTTIVEADSGVVGCVVFAVVAVVGAAVGAADVVADGVATVVDVVDATAAAAVVDVDSGAAVAAAVGSKICKSKVEATRLGIGVKAEHPGKERTEPSVAIGQLAAMPLAWHFIAYGRGGAGNDEDPEVTQKDPADPEPRWRNMAEKERSNKKFRSSSYAVVAGPDAGLGAEPCVRSCVLSGRGSRR